MAKATSWRSVRPQRKAGPAVHAQDAAGLAVSLSGFDP